MLNSTSMGEEKDPTEGVVMDDSWGVPDVAQLADLDDETVADNLRERFEHGEVFTFAGSILLVLNPYMRLPIYDSQCMDVFMNAKLSRAPPHLYAIAEQVRMARVSRAARSRLRLTRRLATPCAARRPSGGCERGVPRKPSSSRARAARVRRSRASTC